MEKVWKKEPLTFEQFEDLWEQNNKPEVAKGLLTMLKDSKSIPDGQRLIFLAKISDSISTPYEGLASFGLLPEYRFTSEDRELGAIAVRFFLEIMPRWDNNAFKRECETILSALGNLPAGEQRGWENKIKVFIHSFLDTRPKEDSVLWEYYVPKALVNNRMFEEMVNYDIFEDSGLKYLIELISPELYYPESSFYVVLYNFRDRFISTIKEALKNNREPHAVSVLLRLLAKRGDLDKIFLNQEPKGFSLPRSAG